MFDIYFAGTNSSKATSLKKQLEVFRERCEPSLVRFTGEPLFKKTHYQDLRNATCHRQTQLITIAFILYLFTYLFITLFNVGQTIVTRLIKTNLTKTNTDIIDKNFKIFDMQHKNSESFVHDSISV